MRIAWLTWVNIKRLIKNPNIILMLIVLPGIMVGAIFANNMGSDKDKKPTIAILDEDKSEKSNELIDKLKEFYKVNLYTDENKEESYKKVEDGTIGELYHIEKGFQDKINAKEHVNIKVVNTGENSGSIAARNKIEDFIKLSITGKEPGHAVKSIIEVNAKENNVMYVVMILMMCYFMVLSSANIGEDIIKLKKQNIIKRSITTANKDYEILGSMLLAIFFIQTISTSLVFIAFYKIMGIKVDIFSNSILVIVLCSLFSTSLVLAAVRWLKNAAVSELLIVVYGLITYVLSMTTMNLGFMGEVPKSLENLSKLSPFYWMGNILNSNNVILSIFIIILMAACFFTAGTFRLKDFAKEN